MQQMQEDDGAEVSQPTNPQHRFLRLSKRSERLLGTSARKQCVRCIRPEQPGASVVRAYK